MCGLTVGGLLSHSVSKFTSFPVLLKQIVDPVEIEKMIGKVLSENPKQLEQYRDGKTKLQGFFAGQVMKLSKGKANPGLLNKILLDKLNGKN